VPFRADLNTCAKVESLSLARAAPVRPASTATPITCLAQQRSCRHERFSTRGTRIYYIPSICNLVRKKQIRTARMPYLHTLADCSKSVARAAVSIKDRHSPDEASAAAALRARFCRPLSACKRSSISATYLHALQLYISHHICGSAAGDFRELRNKSGKPTIWQPIADALRSDLAKGRYGPGNKLPTEAVLADRFGVTRHTVRHGSSARFQENLVAAGRRPEKQVRALDERRQRRTRPKRY